MKNESQSDSRKNDPHSLILETIAIVRKRFERDCEWLASLSRDHPELTMDDLLHEHSQIWERYVKQMNRIHDALEEIDRRQSTRRM